MLAPTDRTAALVVLLHRDVDHESVGSRAVPVLLSRLEEHAIAWPDDLDRSALPLTQPDTFGHVDRLPVRVRVPRGSRARCEVHGGRGERGRTCGRGHGVDV